jgi:hypothetical protein
VEDLAGAEGGVGGGAGEDGLGAVVESLGADALHVGVVDEERRSTCSVFVFEGNFRLAS